MHSQSPADSGAGPQRQARVILLGILGLTALAYLACLRYGFVYDDYPQIVNNGHLVSWQFLPTYFTHHVWSQVSSSGTYYRPIFLLWLRINEALFGVQTALPWHLTTLLLHLLATALLYAIMRRTIPNGTVAVIATLVFALHPGHVESVAWISGCTEPLMASAMFGALLCWMNRDEPHGVWWYSASLLLFLLALMVKETAVLLPALIFVYAIAWQRLAVQKAIATIIPFAVVAAAELAVRHYALHGGVPEDIHPIRETLFTFPAAIVFYATHLVWPVRLSPFYDVVLANHLSAVSSVIALLVAGIFVLIAKASREALIAVAWIVLPVLPALAGIRVFDSADLVHDRYLYLSTVGLGILLGLALSRLPDNASSIIGMPAKTFLAASLFTVLMIAGTALEIQPWQSNLTLFVRSVEVAPKSPPAFNHLAYEMYKRGDAGSAHRFYQTALSLDSQDWPASFGIAVLDMRTGNLAESDRYFQHAIDLKPQVTNATYLLQGQVRLLAGRPADAEQSVRRAIELWPSNLGQHLLLAQILVSERRLPEAKSEFEQELQLDPTSVGALTGLQSLAR